MFKEKFGPLDQQLDLMKDAADLPQTRCWVLSNPPYGERIRVDFTPDELFRRLIDVYNPEQIGLVLSENQAKELTKTYEQIQNSMIPAEDRMHLKGSWGFSNGGIMVRFVLFSRFVQDL